MIVSRAVIGLAGLSVGAVGLGGAGRAPATLTQLPDVPHLWSWDVRGPSPAGRAGHVALIMRGRPTELVPSGRRGPLAPGDGDERTVAWDGLAAGESLGGTVTLQLHDVRRLGVEPDGPAALRLQGRVTLRGVQQEFTLPVEGHSVASAPELHPPAWRGDELPLVSFVTLSEAGALRWTVALAATSD